MGGYLMLKGKQSWVFHNRPVIRSSAVSVGPFEAEGNLANDFDIIHDDLWMGKDSYEKAHRLLLEEAVQTSLKKANLQKEDINYMIAGDLINQITPSNFAASTLQIPYMGIFGACSTSMEGLALASFIVNYKGAQHVVTGASSHNSAVEKQFRYPTEYGGQKPPTAQWTVTGAGAAIVSDMQPKPGDIVACSATIGRVVDMGLSDPFNMGGAMAPAAADTIISHLQDMQLEPSHYDLILTGDLGKIGRETTLDLLEQYGFSVSRDQFKDCGLLIYKENQPVQSGGSGAGCSATVLYSHIFNQMRIGKYKRILVVATGALLSPLTFQQKETIPCTAHAVSLELIT